MRWKTTWAMAISNFANLRDGISCNLSVDVGANISFGRFCVFVKNFVDVLYSGMEGVVSYDVDLVL